MDLIAQGQLGAAYDWLEAEVRQGRESAEYCRRLAWLGLAIQDIRAVEIWCHESLRIDDASPEPHILLGYALLREARWVESREEFDAGLRREMNAGRRTLAMEFRNQASQRIPEWA